MTWSRPPHIAKTTQTRLKNNLNQKYASDPRPPHTRQKYEQTSGQNMTPNALKQGKFGSLGAIFLFIFLPCVWGLGLQKESLLKDPISHSQKHLETPILPKKQPKPLNLKPILNTEESNRPPAPIILKSITIHLPFLSRHFCKSMPSFLAQSSVHTNNLYHDTAPVCDSMLLQNY